MNDQTNRCSVLSLAVPAGCQQSRLRRVYRMKNEIFSPIPSESLPTQREDKNAARNAEHNSTQCQKEMCLCLHTLFVGVNAIFIHNGSRKGVKS